MVHLKLSFNKSYIMTKNPPGILCPRITGKNNGCEIKADVQSETLTPLSSTCGCDRVKVCRVSGDRRMCARMAQLGVLPGSEMELICPGKSKCMVRVKGSTVTLDELQARHIFVTPV